MSSAAKVELSACESTSRPVMRTWHNLANVMGGEAMLRVANFAAAVVIARNCGSATFGKYVTILAYVTIATMLADNGLQVSAVTEIASRPSETNVLCSRLYVAKSMLFVPMMVLLAAIAAAVRLSPADWVIAVLITLRTVLQSYCQVQIAILKAIDRLQSLGVIQGVHSAFLLAALGLLYHLKSGIGTILLLLLAGQLGEFACEAGWLRYSGMRLVRVRIADCLRFVHRSTPVGMALAIQNATQRLDVIVVSLLAGASAAGVFAAAQTAIMIVYVVGWLLGSVLLPEMMRIAKRTRELDAYIRKWLLTTESFVIPMVALAMLIAPQTIRFLFGPKFHDSGRVLLLMMPAAPFIIANSILMNRALAVARSRVYLLVYSSAAVLALLLNSATVLRFGAAGVAVAVVVREALITMSFEAAYRRRPPVPLYETL